MKNTPLSLLVILFFLSINYLSLANNVETIMVKGNYTLFIEGFDWGPAVNKVILELNENVDAANRSDYSVSVKRSTSIDEIEASRASGERTVTYAYVSDAKGNKQATGKHITLLLVVGPELVMGSPIEYIWKDGRGSNYWIDYQLSITNQATNTVWDQEIDRIMPQVDQFDTKGSFTYKEDLTMSYASFKPKTTTNKKIPLIIWLHGGGEGGSDATIPLVANKATNYAAPSIQAYFGGAYVLVPQCPGAWMHNAEAKVTLGKENDIYNEGLMALIKDYVAKHPDIDTDRIYVGGCSNGGYMSLKLILLYPDYFAAGYISALAYYSKYIQDEEIARIKDVPMWFIHSKDDDVTPPEQTAVPVYNRLIAAGAPNVHFSYYDHVIDVTGFFGGKDYHYHGHWSWIYSHANESRLDFDGQPVMLDGAPVTIMEWMAAQRR